ncbi:MAG: GNAT family N-acetyltransferase [Deltaproteobacteria bacterium]|nr:GNAT family N-acetyltransferase [Deltaproteobacteria bacterium]
MIAGLAQAPVLRPMRERDLDRLVEIDTQVFGQSRPEYWELKLELMARKAPSASLVAELDGKVVGFIVGGASEWEYGVPKKVGWIDAIGVDPEYQRRGIAKMLLTEMVGNLKNAGVERIYTFVNWRDWRLLPFFDAMGFRRGDMLNLELKV